MPLKTVLLLLIAILTAACVGAIRLHSLPANHPANPAAQQAPLEKLPETLEADSGIQPRTPAEPPAEHHRKEQEPEHDHGADGSGEQASFSSDVVHGRPGHSKLQRVSLATGPRYGRNLVQESA